MGRPARVERSLFNAQIPVTKKERNQMHFLSTNLLRKKTWAYQWPMYETKRGGWCEACWQNEKVSRPQFKCSTCNISPCSNNKKTVLLQFITSSYLFTYVFMSFTKWIFFKKLFGDIFLLFRKNLLKRSYISCTFF